MTKLFDRAAYIEKCKELGKSESFVVKTLKYADNLFSKGLPVIFDLSHLTNVMGVNPKELAVLAEIGRGYKAFYIRKKSGGKRLIVAPSVELRNAQKWINDNILRSVPLHVSAHGFREKHSILSNATSHVNKEQVLNVDLKSFFHTIYRKRVYGIFRSLGYTHVLSQTFARLTTVILPAKLCGDMEHVPIYRSNMAVLPQGAPTSPTLANIAASGLDRRFSSFAHIHDIAYTRYADDITFSGPANQMPSIAFLVQVVKEEGFWLNFAKYRKYGRQHRQIVTGIIVNDGIRVKGDYKREVWTHLYFSKKYGPFNHLAKRGLDKRAFRDWLLGKILFIKSIEPKVAEKMRVLFDAIDWSFE